MTCVVCPNRSAGFALRGRVFLAVTLSAILAMKLAPTTRAQDIDPLAARKKQLQAEKETLTLEKEVTTLQNDLRTAQAKPFADSLASLNAIPKPSGAFSIAADGVESPASSLLGAKVLKLAAADVAADVEALKPEQVVLVPVGSELLTRLRRPLFETTRAQIAYDGNLLIAELTSRKATPEFAGTTLPKAIDDVATRPVTAVTGMEIAVAVPAVLAAVSGLFNVDQSEKVFTGSPSDADAAACVVAALRERNQQLTVWCSREAYLSKALGGQLNATATVKAIQDLNAQSGRLEYVLSFVTQEMARALAAKKVQEDGLKQTQASIAELVADQRKDRPLKADMQQQERDDEVQRRTLRDERIGRLQTETAALENEIVLQAQRVEVFTSLGTRLAAQVTKAEAFLSTLATKDGEYPLLLWLLMEEKIAAVDNPPLQLGVKAVSQKGSTITRKSLLGSKHYANATVVLRYTASLPDGRILKTGVAQRGLAFRLPKPGSLLPLDWDALSGQRTQP